MQGTFGPQGLDKMLYKTNGETAVSTTVQKSSLNSSSSTRLQRPSSNWLMLKSKRAGTA